MQCDGKFSPSGYKIGPTPPAGPLLDITVFLVLLPVSSWPKAKPGFIGHGNWAQKYRAWPKFQRNKENRAWQKLHSESTATLVLFSLWAQLTSGGTNIAALILKAGATSLQANAKRLGCSTGMRQCQFYSNVLCLPIYLVIPGWPFPSSRFGSNVTWSQHLRARRNLKT